MPQFIDNIHIVNFKSLKDFQISGCKRINLFIGRPNVGKSNILEALSLFSLPFLKENSPKKLSDLIRLETEAELFCNGNSSQLAEIKTNIGDCVLGYSPKDGLMAGIDFFSNGSFQGIQIDEKLNVKGIKNREDFESPVKRYNYKADVSYRRGHAKYLIPPFGWNLFSIIDKYEDLKADVIKLFKDYDLDIVFDIGSQSIKIIQASKSNKGEVFLIPYNSIADTLQRIIFFKSAIASNDNSILLFEEPEAHSFPPYMTHITQEMIYKTDNQYFVATHSPFILNDLLENGREELAVFNIYYDKHETRARLLSSLDMHDVVQNGIDLFTNNESYI